MQYKRHFSHKRTSFVRQPAQGRKFTKAPQRVQFDPSRFVNKAAKPQEVAVFTPTHRFADFPIDEALKRAIAAKGYTLPTPIQDQAITPILGGRDIVGIAQTGTGKTAAFLIPLIHKVRHDPDAQVLIVVPTRELAAQISEELVAFTAGMKIFSVCCVGGISIGAQMYALRRRNQFVIGTPVRLKDLIERGKIKLAEFQTIVLDEADRMLDMGFIRDMRFVMAGMPSPRHTLFFSATLSPEVEGLIKDFLHNPVRVQIANRRTAEHISQDVVQIPRGADKLAVLHDLLIQPGFDKVLVFGRTKHGVERLSKNLVARGFKAESIHGNKTQNRRQKALSLFKQDHVQILVATDVAARGLDINGVSHVINYDLPATHDDYIHRIGRTGRAGKPGKALTFVG